MLSDQIVKAEEAFLFIYLDTECWTSQDITYCIYK